MAVIDIAALSQQSGLPASTLRYYEQRGLIASIGRHGLRRLFDARVLERLPLIALGQTAGFSLDEVAAMLTRDGGVRIDRTQLAAKAAEVERTIQKLGVIRDGLRHAAKCPAPSHLECPTFQRILRGAAQATRRARPPRQRAR